MRRSPGTGAFFCPRPAERLNAIASRSWKHTGRLRREGDRGENRHAIGRLNFYYHCIAKQKTGGWIAEQSVFPASTYSTLWISSGIRPLTLPS